MLPGYWMVIEIFNLIFILWFIVTYISSVDYIVEVAKTTGIILDPTYTGKCVNGLVKAIKNNRSRFKGRRILYIHTGKLN